MDKEFTELTHDLLISKLNIYTLKNKISGDIFKNVKLEPVDIRYFFKPPSKGDDYVIQIVNETADGCIGRLNVNDWLIKYEGRDEN
jgi:hypothetical protein